MSSFSVSDLMLNALPYPVVMVALRNKVLQANVAAEEFFQASNQTLQQQCLEDFFHPTSAVLMITAHARTRQSVVREKNIDIGGPKFSGETRADIVAIPLPDQPENVVLMFLPQTLSEQMGQHFAHRAAARSVTGLASMLAHEIKNPLSGIRGAAQLLEATVEDSDRTLTRLIRDETDRIVTLVNHMEAFSDERPLPCEEVNIHTVLEHVKRLAQSGFAKHVHFIEDYDPSLPFFWAHRDSLVQILINLIKNAAEALDLTPDATIILGTAYRPGVRMAVSGKTEKISLPLEVSVRDNGSGINQDILAHVFDPFVTTKASGTGLGLALVSKSIGSMGGVVTCESQPRRTVFRILMPHHKSPPHQTQ